MEGITFSETVSDKETRGEEILIKWFEWLNIDIEHPRDSPS